MHLAWLVGGALCVRVMSAPGLLQPMRPTHTRDQHFLHKSLPPGLPRRAFEALQSALLDSPLLTRPTRLNEGNFGTTSGVLVYFNADGEAALRECPLFEPLAAFFDAVRLPEANAFTLNVLTSKPSAALAVSAGQHVDNTLTSIMPEGWNGVAHQTDVLYVQVPPDMRRGTLQLWRPDLYGGRPSSLQRLAHDGERPHASGTCQGMTTYGPPAEVVVPMENQLVSFRGDSIHRVTQHSSSAPGRDGWRVSLVLEQYILEEEQVGDMPSFHVSGQTDPELAEHNTALLPCRHLLAERAEEWRPSYNQSYAAASTHAPRVWRL